MKVILTGSMRWSEASTFGGKILPRWPKTITPPVLNNKFFKNAFSINDGIYMEGPCSYEAVWGTNMIVRKGVFDNGWRYNPHIGPKGKNYIMGSETELLLRLDRAGFKSIYLPSSIVYHQIRPEQLNLKWVFGRAFRAGRSSAYLENNTKVTKLFGIPRYLIRQIVELVLKRIFSIFSFNKSKQLDLGIKYWFALGELFEHRIRTTRLYK